MEFKKSEPNAGQLDGRSAVLIEYEFPRATRESGRFLPAGVVKIREYLFCDGAHGQFLQFVVIPIDELAKGNEKRFLVNCLLALGREDKLFRDGELTSQGLSGEVRDFLPRKMLCVEDILTGKEKIGRFATALQVRDIKVRNRRARRWKVRSHLLLLVGVSIFALWGGSFLERNDFFDMRENSFYNEYVMPSYEVAKQFWESFSSAE